MSLKDIQDKLIIDKQWKFSILFQRFEIPVQNFLKITQNAIEYLFYNHNGHNNIKVWCKSMNYNYINEYTLQTKLYLISHCYA